MTPIVLILVVGFATARAVRLWRDDSITQSFREWLYDKLTEQRGHIRREIAGAWLVDLLDCPWCLSGWVAAASVAVVDLATDHSVPVPALTWLAAWQVAMLAYWSVELLADKDQVLVETGNTVRVTGSLKGPA